jgi:hypothetical protein
VPHWPKVVVENITDMIPYLPYSRNFGISNFDKQGRYNLSSAIDFLQENRTYKVLKRHGNGNIVSAIMVPTRLSSSPSTYCRTAFLSLNHLIFIADSAIYLTQQHHPLRLCSEK